MRRLLLLFGAVLLFWSFAPLVQAEKRIILSTGTLSATEGDYLRSSSHPLTISLSEAPSGQVHLTFRPNSSALRFGLTGEGLSHLVSTSNWNNPRQLNYGYNIVGLTAVTLASAEQDPNAVSEAVTVRVQAFGGGYNGVETTLTVNIADDDQGVVLPTSAVAVNEGSTARFKVRLNQPPNGSSQTQTVTLMQPGNADVRVDTDRNTPGNQNILNFTSSNWSTGLDVTVSAAQDLDGMDESARISASSPGIYPASMSVSVTDDDPALLLPSAPVSVNEGDTASFRVSLNKSPGSGGLAVSLGQPDNIDVTVSPATLNFTDGNWSTGLYVRVSASEDSDAAGDSAAIAVSAPGIQSGSVAVTVLDNDTADMVLPTSAVSVREGMTATFKVRLDRDPGTSGLAVTLSQPDNTDVTVDTDTSAPGNQTALNFDGGNWFEGLDVTVRASQDSTLDDETATINLSGAGGISGRVSVAVLDDEEFQLAGIPTSALTLTEGAAGTTVSTFRLAGPPSGEVDLRFSSSSAKVTVDADTVTSGSQSTLTFTARNWNTAQGIVLAAPEDADASDETVTISISASGGGFDGVTGSFQVQVDDNDTAGIGLGSYPDLIARIGEGSGGGTKRVWLTAQPSGNVTLQISNSLPGMQVCAVTLTGCPAAFTFTPSNYSVEQSIKITALEDANAVNEIGTATFTASGGGYSGISRSLQIGTLDNDTAGLIVGGARSATEGGTGSFTVRLRSEPTADVTVAATAGSDIASVAPASLTFTPGNWNTDQTFTVTADTDTDTNFDDSTGSVSLRASGGDYGSVSAGVDIAVTDADAPDLDIAPAVLLVSEGAGGSYAVRLSGPPSDAVTVSATSGDAGAATVQSESLVFTTSNWNVAQNFSVTSSEDTDTDNESTVITFSASGGGYAGVTRAAAFNAADNDAHRLVLSEAALLLNEGAAGRAFTVSLSQAPTANVSVTLSTGGDVSAVTISPAATWFGATVLTFTPSNWQTPQSVTVTPVDDNDFANEILSISLIAAGGGYDGADGRVPIQVLDDDAPGLIWNSTDRAYTETDASHTTSLPLSFRLAHEPSGNVMFNVTSSNPDFSVQPHDTGGFVISADSWSASQSINTILAPDEDAADETARITLIFSGGGYGGFTESFDITIDDDETAGLTIADASSLQEGGSGSFTVALSAVPTVNVTVTPSAGDGIASVAPASLNFTPTNWSAPQTVTVEAGTDADSTASTGRVALSASGGEYGGVSADVDFSIADTAAGALAVQPASASVIEGADATYRVSLSLRPSGDVTVSASSARPAAASVGSTDLTFTSSNWDTPQSLAVSALEDTDSANEVVSIVLTASGGGYSGVSRSLTLNIVDNEAAVLVLSETSLELGEGGAAGAFAVRLSAQPSATVQLRVMSGDPARVEVDAVSGTTGLQSWTTFTPSNWSTPQTISVRALEDSDRSSETVAVSLVASGGGYSGQTGSVSVSVIDDEFLGFVLSGMAVTVDEGGSTSFGVRLNQAPTENVGAALTVPAGDVMVDALSLTFTPADWDTEQHITVYAAQDADADDDSLILTLTASGGRYAGASSDIAVTIDDDDDPNLVLSSRTLSIGEGEAAVFKVMLDGAPPSGGLTATLTQPGNADVTVDAHAASSTLQTRLNFNAGNWSSGLEVTVRAGHDDDLVDDSATIQIAVAGGDSDSLTVQVDDDDEAQLSGLPTSALTVVEGAGSTISGFWLSAQPGADVTVAFASSNTDSVTLSPASLTFTADNWDTAQSITLTGVEDSDADDETVSISITAAGGGFDGLASSFQALVDDNDTAAIQVPNQENLVAINEDVTISQGVRLTSRPSGTVTLTLSTSLSSMQICQNVPSICPQTLTFTPGNYSALQYFKLWSRPDHNAFDETGTATFAAAGGGYDGVTLSVPIGSNDSGTTGLNIGGDRSATEGGAGSFTVRLNSEPISDVTLSATPGRGIASVSPASLRFTQSNWNADQTVTATTSIDDSVLSDTTGLISLSAAGGDYGGVTETVSIDISNSGSGTLRVTPASQAVLEGHTGTILVRLNAQPSGNVTVSASGDDDSAVAVLDETLTFTELTWDTVQQVAVSALDDADADSERVTVEFSASGGGYSGATESVTVRTVEDDASGLWISADSLSLVEGAPAATFTVRLSRAPTQNVAVTLSSSGDTGAATVNAGTGAGTSNASSELSFTPSNWDVLQTVSVAPTADDGDARSESLTITLSAAGGSFDGATGSVQVTVLDDDTQALAGSAADAALDEGLNSGVISAPEGGFTVGLSSEPSAAVTVILKSANPDVAFLNASGERISSIVLDDWGAGALQTLYYAVAHDGDASDETAAITLSAAGGGFDGIALEYTLTIRDDEVPGISVSPGTVRNRLTLAEGGMGSFYAALTQPPMVDVQVALAASDIAAGYALSPMSASFTPNNWNSPREFQLSVPEDADASDERTSISLNASGGIYTGVSQDVLVTIQDDEMAGLNVSPAGMLSATEGEAADYSVSLSTPPTDSVTVSAISDDPSAVSLGAMALTFSRANWNTAQSLRVNALQDADRANESVTITLTASGGGYGSVSRGLSFQVIDDDATSLVLSHSALGVDEGGQAGRFTVRLSSQPSGSVWIALASGEPARVEVDAAPGTTGRQSRMTFTASNWNIPQIVSVRGLDDADGSDDSVTVNLRASGGGYDGQSASVAVSVMDDESFSLVVSETSMTLEEGAAGSFSVQLNTAPSVDVTVALALPSGSDLTANPPTLIFTPSNWNVARDVSVSAGQDADTLNDSAELSLSASGGEFSGASAQVAVMVDDDDNPGLVLPSAAISAAESVPVIFGVRLSTQPSADVTLTLMQPSNPDVTVDADTSASGNQNVMTFTPQNWRISQNVSVMSGEDDDAADDSAVLRIVAAGGGYDLVSAEVEVSVADNDSPALTLSHTALTVGESGVATFAVQLSTQPSQDVRLTLTSSDTTALTVRVGGTAAAANSAGLLFTPENWSAAQSVTLAGVDDADTLSELVTVAVSASGGEYAGVSAHLAATLTDDDAPQLVVTPSLALTEGGAAGSLSVRLDTQPSADLTVTVAVSGGDADALRVTAGAALIFTPLNWSVDQTVSISPADDADANDQSTTITMSVAAAAGGTAASGYESISATTTVTVTDDDAEGLSISPVQLTVEEGASATFEVRLTSEPNADVTVTLGQPDNTDITLSAGGGNVLTFTGANWNTAQTVTVSAAEDRDGIDDAASAISLTADEAGAADGGYEGVSASVAVSVQDDDEIALTLSQGSVTVDEGGSASFSVQLATQPDDTVTVALRQPGNADITVSTAYAGTSGEATLIFASTSWDMPQMVTLSAAQDDDAIDDAGSISLTASGGGYDSATGSVSVTVDDDEGVGFTLVQETLSLVEGGDAESFTVALSSRPTSRVRLTLDNPDPEALTLTSGQAGTTGGRIELTFSAIDWNAPQTLSAQAVEDNDTGDESVGIVLTASGGGYDGVTGSYVISVTDNDSPSLRLSRSDVALDEGGATMNFTVRLIGQPSEDVTVSVTSSDAGAVSVSAGATLVFTPRNWDTPQRVTLNPQDDVDAYDESAVITLSASGTDYAGISASVSVSVTDDEEMGLALSWSEAVVIEGASESLDVSLISAPTGDVQVSAKSADLGAVAVTSEALTFTRENWNIPQAVMLQSQQDDDARSESVRLTLISSGGDYDGQSAAAVVAVTDNDRAGLVVPQEAVEVSEGGSAFFNVRLTSQPASGVAVALAVGGDLSLSHPTVNFTSVDWNRNRVVRVDAGHDDDALDDVQTLELTASGADYGGVTGRMSITVDDDERAGLSVTGAPVRVDEGGAANFQIALASRPSADVAVALSSPDTAIVTVSPGRLDFTASNWDEPQTVRVAGVEDVDPDNQRLQLALRASGGDYAGISTTATVEVTDNDSPNLLLPSTTLRTVEGGASADFRVRLSTLPAGDVTVNASVAVQDAAEAGITAGAELTFTASDWNVEQTISVAPLDDFDAVDEEVRIELRASGADYSSVTRHVTLNIADDDEASLVLSEQALQLAEGASSRSLTVRLSSQPTHNVIISVASDHDSVEAVTQNLAFSPAQWDAPQALALSSPEDDDGLDHTAHIRLEASGGDYTGMSASLQVSVADNDTQALRLSGETVTLTEGGEGSFTVALATPPSGSVIVSVTTDSTTLATVSPARLLFTSVHWSTPQTVTVTGHQDDNASDEEVALALSASGADYQGISASLTANISDDEQAGLALSQRALQLTEGGSSRALEVSLLIQPTVPVTLHTASTSSLLLANPGTLIFTPSNWGQVQTMRIRSLDDDDLEDGVETLTLSANGGEYEGVSSEVVVSVLDNDRSPGLSVSATQIDLSEGSSAHFTVQLNSPPSADLTVSMASPGTADPVVIAPVQLTFNGDNWNIPQRISIKALQDDNAVGERIVLQLRGDGAAEYRSLTASVALTLSDDETVGLRVTRQGVEMGASTLLMLEEGGGMTVHVELLTEPVQPVTLDIITGSAAKVVTVPDRLSFTSSNWRGGRLVQISAQQDEDRQDEAAVPIEFRTDESSGPYFGQSVRFHVAITDDDEGAPIEEERMAVERTLNEVARTVITGATEVMGYRLDAGLGSRTGTFAGREIDLGKPGDAGEGPASWTASGEPEAAGRFDADWFGHERMSGNWFGGVELERGRPVQARSDEVDSRAPFIGDFIYALDSGLRTDGEYGSGWTVWGRFDQRNFSGAFQQSRPGVDGTQRVSVDGAQTGFWIGIDQRVSERLLYGFAISHGSGDTEYNLHRFDGAMQTTLSTVMPYLEFETENGLSMRFMYGLGSGTAELQDSGRQKAEAGLQVGMASMGLHWPMLHLGRSTLALTGGLSTSRVRTSQETSASLRSLKASNYRLRGGVEFGHSGFGKGWRIAPRIGLSLRQDEGEDSGVNGIGTELHATLRLSTPLNRVGIELNTHWLNARADEQMDETGASMEFRISGRDAAGRGLSMRIGPEWGARRDGVLDRDDAFNLEQGPQIGSDERRQRSALGADLGYSLDALGGMLTPYTEYRLTAGVHASEQRSAGLRFRRADQLQTRLFFEQRINQGADDTAGLGFEFSRRF